MPLCGKKIDCRYDSRRVKQNKLLRFFLFARCSNCDKYYGQAVFTSVYMKIMFYLFVPSLIAAYLLQEGRILIIYLLLLIPSVFLIPIRKMNENEELVTDDCEKKYFSIYMGKYHIRKNQVYFLTDRFDNYSAFSAVSPICIETFDKKSGRQTRIIRTRFLSVDFSHCRVKILVNPLGLTAFCASLRKKSAPQKICDPKRA